MNNPECEKCGADMLEEDILAGPTTHINQDEIWEKALVCEECGHVELIEEDYE